jgi:hypothetical protein
MFSMRASRCLLPILLLLAIPAGSSAITFVNRVTHYPPGEPPYTTVEDVALDSTTWNAANGPYVVEATVTIMAGSTLAIEPGTQVWGAELGALHIYGTLNANQVQFSTYGSQGFWRGIYFAPTAGASILNNCQIADSGGVGYCYYGCRGLGYFHEGDKYAAIYIDDCNPTITNNTISNPYGHAIQIWGGSPTITGNTMTAIKPGYAAIHYENTGIFPVISGNSAEGTGYIGVLVPQGTIGTSGTWTIAGDTMPYLLNGVITIAAGQTLTVEPGAMVKAVHEVVGIQALGVLKAEGTSAKPITFTTAKATPGEGDWIGIYVGPDSGATSIQKCHILHSGGVGYCYYGCRGHNIGNAMDKFAAIYVDGSSPTITDNLITKIFGSGIQIWGGTPTITGNTITDVRPEQAAIRYDNTNIFPVIHSNTGSGTGLVGVVIPPGTVSTNGTWTIAGDTLPYFLAGTVTIASGKTLTVEPGAVVKALNDVTGIQAIGVLRSEGTPEKPITFTTAVATPTEGNWIGIYIGPESGETSILNSRILHAGGLGYCYYGCRGHNIGNAMDKFAAIYVDGSSPTINGNQITNSYGNGLEVWNGSPNITGNSISNLHEGYYAVYLDTVNTFPVMSGNAFTGTGYAGVYSPGGEMTTSGTWNKAGPALNWFLGSSLTLPADKALTIEPGITVFVPQGNIGLYIAGTLTANGPTEAPVIFTSRAGTPAKGDWNGIYLAPTAGNSTLANASIRYAGGFGYCSYGCSGLGTYNGAVRYTGLYVDSCAPNLAGITVADTYGNGIDMFASNTPLTGVTIERAYMSALRLEGGASPAITNTAITDCGFGDYWAVSIDAACKPVPTNVTLSGNKYQGVWVRGGTVNGSTVWKQWSPTTPYYMDGTVTVDATATLTIEPSVTVKANSVGMIVNGTLIADGTQGAITFTSLRDDTVAGDSDANGSAVKPDVGQWAGIYLGPQAGVSVLKFVNVRYGAGYNNGAGTANVHGEVRYASVLVDGCNPVLDNVQIRDGWYDGLQMWGASPTVRNSMITTHGYSGIVTQLASAPTISGVTVAGNDTGIYTGNSNMTLVNSIVSANRLGINAGGTNNPVIRHSCVHTNRSANFTGIADPGTANGNIQQNPLFQNPTAGNYRLMNGSPCVDAGDDSVLTDGQLDLAGIARKQGTHVDMGAWEIPVAGAYSWSDVRDALRVAGGLLEPSPAQYTRLNVVSDSRVNLLDAVRLGRKVSGLEPNQ